MPLAVSNAIISVKLPPTFLAARTNKANFWVFKKFVRYPPNRTCFAQRIGLSLDEIDTELGKLPAEGVPTGRDWSRLSGEWTSRIDERIAELERLKVGLTECIGCGCLSLDRCRLANPADRAARHGPGPRFWIGSEA